jgi:hypothetical protein
VDGPESPSNSVIVPRTNRNPIRSLAPAPVIISIGSRELTFPALPAAEWLTVLMGDWTPDDLFLDLMPDGVRVLSSGELSPDDTVDMALDVIEEVSGRNWWVALNIIQAMVEVWDVMGAEAIFNNVDAQHISLAAWLDAMLVLLLRRTNPDQGPMLVAMLEKPPPGEELPEEDFEMSTSRFLSMGGE